MNHYAARNEGLVQLIAAPATVNRGDRGAWANAFSAAQATGPDTVFRILLALDTSIERAEGKRYRKRRRLYSPSW